MSEYTTEELVLLKLSKAKDGDMLVISSDDIDQTDARDLKLEILKSLKLKVSVVVIPGGSSISLIEQSEAEAILTAIAQTKKKT